MSINFFSKSWVVVACSFWVARVIMRQKSYEFNWPEVHLKKKSMSRVLYNKLLTNLACSSRTWEYWPSVVFVRTSWCLVRTVMTSGQYSQYGLRAQLIRGYAVVKTSPSPRNILAEKKVATQLRSFQDLPSPLVHVSREKSGHAADHPSHFKYVSKERSSYAAMQSLQSRVAIFSLYVYMYSLRQPAFYMSG